MNRIAFTASSSINRLIGALTLITMGGLSLAGATALASGSPSPSLPQLPLVVVTGKAPAQAYRLPTVVVTAKRGVSNAVASSD